MSETKNSRKSYRTGMGEPGKARRKLLMISSSEIVEIYIRLAELRVLVSLFLLVASWGDKRSRTEMVPLDGDQHPVN